LAESILHDYADQLPGGVTLIPGSGGIFEVTYNGQLIYSKAQTGRFPNPNEVEEKLEALLG